MNRKSSLGDAAATSLLFGGIKTFLVAPLDLTQHLEFSNGHSDLAARTIAVSSMNASTQQHGKRSKGLTDGSGLKMPSWMPSPKSHEQYLSTFRQRYWISQSVHGALMQHCILLSSWLMGDFHQSGSRGVFLNQAVEFGDPHREHKPCFQVPTRLPNTLHSPGSDPNTFYDCSGSLMFSEMMKNKGEKWRTSVTVQTPAIRAEADLRAESQAHKTKKFILFLFSFQKNKKKKFFAAKA